MNVSDIAAELAADYGLSKAAARAITQDILDTVASALVAGEGVRLHGLGNLSRDERAPRSGTGPNGQPWTAPAKTVVRFRPAKALRDALNPVA